MAASDFGISITLPHGDTKFKLRVSTGEGYTTLGEGEFTIDQIQPFLKALDEGTGSAVTRAARQHVYQNRKAKEQRLKSLKQSVADLEEELGVEQ